MISIDYDLTPESLLPDISVLWELSARKIDAVERTFDPALGSPVFTVQGTYQTRGWTEWTQGFQFGSAILQFDATSENRFLELGRRRTLERMARHVTHFGVHDHGFNNVSTYGNLRRLLLEEKLNHEAWELAFYDLALKCSAAVQARRWTRISDGGFIYSFNGPHSLFADTIRSLRSLAVGYHLGHVMMEENDREVSLLERLTEHAIATARYSVYYGEGRDHYDRPGRVAHESIFNVNDGRYRCPSTQQGYSPFTTWTRGLAWIICGFAEQLEFLETVPESSFPEPTARVRLQEAMLRAAIVTSDFYIENTPTDGIPFWDTGAPLIARSEKYLEQPSDPYNDFEPVDSSAAAIAAQGLLRLGRSLKRREAPEASKYWQAGLTVSRTLLNDPYLSRQSEHQGLLLHSVYHRPNGWDYVPPDRSVPCGESSMWGDYHLRELALYLQRCHSGPYLTFWGQETGS